MTKKLALAFALLVAHSTALRADAAAPTPWSQDAGTAKVDAIIDRLDSCRLDLIACVQGAVRAGTPMKAVGCRRTYQTCNRAAAAPDANVVGCRQECLKAWNVCRRDAAPAYVKAQKACFQRRQKHCEEARKGLDACIDGRQACEARCSAAAVLVEIP